MLRGVDQDALVQPEDLIRFMQEMDGNSDASGNLKLGPHRGRKRRLPVGRA